MNENRFPEMKELSRRVYAAYAKLMLGALNIHEGPPKRPAGSARAGSNVRDVSRVISSLRQPVRKAETTTTTTTTTTDSSDNFALI
jgi:hypothetical protein